MFKRITNNLTVKLICFSLAAFLWIYVTAGQNSVGKFPSSLKIKTINVSAGLVAIYDNKTVEIKIMAEPRVWKSLSSSSFSAYVDTSSLTAGTYELPVNVVSSVPGVQVVERNPDKIFVTLEPIITKKVGISKKIEGSAGDGLIAGTVEFEPSQVEASGPKSLIESLTEATATISLNGETSNVKKTVPIIALDEKGDTINSIQFVPSEVVANITIVKASNNKTVGIKVKTTGTPKTGYYVSNIATVPGTIDITGPQSAIADLNYIETHTIDIDNISSNTEQEVLLKTPSGVALQAGSPSKVLIRITVSPVETSREITAKVKYEKDAAIEVESMDPGQVRVVVSGPAELISTLTPNDVILTFDLKGKEEGIERYTLSAANFTVPNGVTIVSILPSSIKITLKKNG